ncbi:RNA polymerase sigma factor (sigma-70 family) [Pseudorhodobacter sp. 4114]|nr:RNA polymerase sigma factor (sigma-70 family) [Pseudorhodobacter sp. 4114]
MIGVRLLRHTRVLVTLAGLPFQRRLKLLRQYDKMLRHGLCRNALQKIRRQITKIIWGWIGIVAHIRHRFTRILSTLIYIVSRWNLASTNAFSESRQSDPKINMTRMTDHPIVPNIVELVPALRAYGRTLCRNAADADDLVQQTLTKAIANADKFTPGTRLRAWLFTIMRNSFYTNAVLRARETTGAADCISGLQVTPATQEWSLRGRELREAINRLPPHYREVLVLVVVLGASYEETASLCNCAVGTVKSRVNRARQLVIEDLGAEAL